jgi:tetratricopeptide (TPR) repeat protein
MKKIILLSVLLFQMTFVFGQNFSTSTELHNAIDLYIDLGYRLKSCKDRCDFDYCSRVFHTWYSSEPKDYYYQKENDIGNAWDESKKSPFKASTCDCSNFEKPNLSLDLKGQKNEAKVNYNKSVDAEKRQQYNNTLNQASTNIQNGNYTDAMQNYTNALNSATTKSEKNLAATGAVISGVGGVFDAFAKAKEEKRERERLEQAQRELEQQQASDLMETTWKNANSFAEQKNFNQAINSMLPYMNANKLNAFSVSKIGFWYAQVKDYESAKICYDKALKLSLKCCAVHYMGDLYQYGQGVAVNYETALTYYKLSCENEDKTGCENYEKLKPIVDEAQKKEKLKKEKAIATISKFNFKPHLDYLVSQLEKQGFLFDNVTFFCTTETSKTLYVSFVKNNLNLETVLKIEYNKEINRSLSYSIDSGDRNLQVDFSKTKLPELIGNEKISNTYSNASHTISAVAPKPISLVTFKNSKYKGFAIETATKSGELLANYIHNYGVSCGNNIEQIKWLTKIIDAGGNLNYYLELENLYKTEGNVEKALETFKNYVSKITNQDDLNTIAEQTNAKLISELKIYHFNKLVVLADTGLGNAAFEVAKHYRKGEIIGESKSTGSNSVSYPYLKVGKNYEKSILYFTKAFDSNFNKGEAACNISKLYDLGGNVIEKNKNLYKEWKKKSKETGYKCK